jgi:hypothetical protein
VKDGIIMDCMRRVGPEENRYRLSLPAHDYVPPRLVANHLKSLSRMRQDLRADRDPKQKYSRCHDIYWA